MIGDATTSPVLRQLLGHAVPWADATASACHEDDDIILDPVTEGSGNRQRIQVLRLEGRMQRRPDFFSRFFLGQKLGPYQAFAALIDRGIAEGYAGLAYVVTSDGGAPGGLENSVRAVLRAREAYGDDRVWALASESANSAAYPILAAAGPGRVYAEPDALVGSLGAYLAVEDASTMLENLGVEIVKRTGGQSLKAPGAPFGVPVTEEQRAWMDAAARAMREGQFFPIVAQLRGISLDAVRDLAGDGQTFTAQQALDRGLIDQIATEDQFFSAVAAQEADMPDTPGREPTPTPPEPLEAEAPQVVEASAAPATPEPPGESPPAITPTRESRPEPAAEAATPSGAPAPAAEADPRIEALTALVAQQGRQIEQLVASNTELSASFATSRRTETLAGYRSRLEAAASLAPGQIEGVMETLAAQLDAGLAAEHQERIVAGYESQPDPAALLREEIPVADGEPVTLDLSFAADENGELDADSRRRAVSLAAELSAAGNDPRAQLDVLRRRAIEGRSN